MHLAKKETMSLEQYFALAEASVEKLEYLGGEIFAMSGGTPNHAQVAMNVGTALTNRLRGRGCRAYSSDLRIHIPDTGLFTYPDISVICGPILYLVGRKDTVVNPVVLVEVLSPSTEAYDRGEKAAHYRSIASLQSYVLVSIARMAVERFDRASDGSWSLRDCPEVLAIPALGIELPVAEIYAEVDFSAVDASPEALSTRSPLP